MTDQAETRLLDADPSVQEDAWVSRQLERRPETSATTVDGISIAFRRWAPVTPAPEPTRTTLLIHGNGAFCGWWDAIAPSLADSEQVIALDLSGHGSSGRRDSYDYKTWADEVFAVLDHVGATGDVVAAGHSMGGLVALTAAWSRPELFRSVIALETPLRRFTPEQLEKRTAIARRPLPRYDSHEAAVDAFKMVPPLERGPSRLVRHVAESSYRREEGGWVLHLDPALYARVTDVDSFLRPYPAATHLVQGGAGLVTDEMLREMRPHLPERGRVISIPGAGHNLIVESPREVADLLLDLRSTVR